MYRILKFLPGIAISVGTLWLPVFAVSINPDMNLSSGRVYSPPTRELNFVDATALNTFCTLSKLFRAESERDKCFTREYRGEAEADLTPVDTRLNILENLMKELEQKSIEASTTLNSLRPEPAVKYVSVINNIIRRENSQSVVDLSAMDFRSDDTNILPGHILQFSTTTYSVDNYDLRGMERASDPKLAVGVASTIDMIKSGSTSSNVGVVFGGRVSVRVSSVNGRISMGDKITLSTSTRGVGVKLVGAGQSIGTALSNDNDSGAILMLLKQEYIFDNNIIMSNSGYCDGEVCLDKSMLSKLVNFVNVILPKLDSVIK